MRIALLIASVMLLTGCCKDVDTEPYQAVIDARAHWYSYSSVEKKCKNGNCEIFIYIDSLGTLYPTSPNQLDRTLKAWYAKEPK